MWHPSMGGRGEMWHPSVGEAAASMSQPCPSFHTAAHPKTTCSWDRKEQWLESQSRVHSHSPILLLLLVMLGVSYEGDHSCSYSSQHGHAMPRTNYNCNLKTSFSS